MKIFGDPVFRKVAYNIFKIKPYIFKIFYTIINKLNNYYFKRNNNIFFQLNIIK